MDDTTGGAATDRRRPTMRDVAARAGVSLKTVSRVVNQESGVSAELAGRVARAIAELDFRPNVGASSLRRADGRTATVGLLLEDVSNPYSSALHRAIEDVALPRGVMVFSASLDEDAERERALALAFSHRRADGLILMPAGENQAYLSSELRAGTAIVCVDRAAVDLAVDSVIATNVTGAAEGVRHLIAGGHRRIAFLGDRPTIATARQRFAGYGDALRAAGLAPDGELVVHELSGASSADGAATSLLARPDPPTALFTAQNLITIGALRALRRLGLEHEVAVVGFDDFPLADLLDPPLTVIRQDVARIGKTVADLLFDRIDGNTSPPRHVVHEPTLVVRGSGEIPPPVS
jgi:LacI family transcriptional regulator